MIIRIEHARQLNYCVWGLRIWFASKEISFREFVKNGVSVEWARQQNDAMAQRLADYVEQRNGR